ncbi:TetR/AcrR family transcriptional regulator [Arthrobacter roseus]|uniref:TetR/AcrR family transcriptional regulator n=1 Tax=Arthrobacter roseus TaxID=136274 RepID=UPI001962B61D|nr:TetR family transcriptional regulator [Arthrobacter roseus]MBM7849417.1 AcrR family transcriptional regulator [Arthrobacter roseus]
MARPTSPGRKIELLSQTLDYFQDKPLSDLSFRTLADGLGISSYVLVYHFGNREQLLNEIVNFVEVRLNEGLRPVSADLTVEGFREHANFILERSLDERHRQSQRLAFEAAMQDPTLERPRGTAVKIFNYWVSFVTRWLKNQGIDSAPARIEARLLVSTLYGIEFSYVISGVQEQSRETWAKAMENFLASLDRSLRE